MSRCIRPFFAAWTWPSFPFIACYRWWYLTTPCCTSIVQWFGVKQSCSCCVQYVLYMELLRPLEPLVYSDAIIALFRLQWPPQISGYLETSISYGLAWRQECAGAGD